METELPAIITQEMKKAVQDALKEMSNSMLRVESEKDLQKSITEKMKDEFNIPKREFTKLAKIFHSANLVEEVKKNEDFLEFAEAVLDNGNLIENS